MLIFIDMQNTNKKHVCDYTFFLLPPLKMVWVNVIDS